jgi:phage terminase Nu1 subunit (DNA packaging protein)
MIVSIVELADIFGVSAPTVRAWVREGCPVKKMGDRGRAFEFRTSEVHRWLLLREKRPGPRLRRRLDGFADAQKLAREVGG